MIYSNIENLVLWASSEKIGFAGRKPKAGSPIFRPAGRRKAADPLLPVLPFAGQAKNSVTFEYSTYYPTFNPTPLK